MIALFDLSPDDSGDLNQEAACAAALFLTRAGGSG